MTGPYDDIIHLPHHVSSTRPRMSMIDRAAQFSPFAALVGYDAEIKEAGRLTERKRTLDEDTQAILNRKQAYLLERIAEHPSLSVTFFLPDKKKAGGTYVTVTGNLKKVDEHKRLMIFTDGTKVPLDDVSEIESHLFRGMI